MVGVGRPIQDKINGFFLLLALGTASSQGQAACSQEGQTRPDEILFHIIFLLFSIGFPFDDLLFIELDQLHGQEANQRDQNNDGKHGIVLEKFFRLDHIDT